MLQLSKVAFTSLFPLIHSPEQLLTLRQPVLPQHRLKGVPAGGIADHRLAPAGMSALQAQGEGTTNQL
jgi:hypothetical protein